MLIKKKLIYLLTAVTVFLLIVNLLFEKYSSTAPEPAAQSDSAISIPEVENEFKDILSLYGIKPEWIRKGKLKKKKSDSLDYYYKIKIPKSVLIPNLIKDLNKKFTSADIKIISEEKTNYGNSTIKIVSGKQTKLIAEFIYSKDLKTPKLNIGFILYGIEDLAEDDLRELLRIPLNFGIVLLPDRDTEQLVDEISDANKQFYLLLSENIDDERYELNEEFTKSVLRLHLKHLFNFYKQNKFFVIDKKSELYRSLAFEFIAKELRRNGKKLYTVQDFIALKGESPEDINSLFEFYLKNIDKNPKKVFYVNASDFEGLLSNILTFTKKGNEVRFPSQMLK